MSNQVDPENDPIAEYYERHRREAEALVEQIRAVKARLHTRDELARLERALERARYVGD